MLLDRFDRFNRICAGQKGGLGSREGLQLHPTFASSLRLAQAAGLAVRPHLQKHRNVDHIEHPRHMECAKCIERIRWIEREDLTGYRMQLRHRNIRRVDDRFPLPLVC